MATQKRKPKHLSIRDKATVAVLCGMVFGTLALAELTVRVWGLWQ